MRHGSPSLPRTLAASIDEQLEQLGGGPREGIGKLVEIWPHVVGAAIAANAWPARFARDGTLIVHTSSSTWAFELGQLEATVRQRLGPAAPRRLRLQHLVPRPSPADVAQGAALARSIADPELRELVARAASSSLAAVARRPGPAGRSGKLPKE
jgi:hypothetical protein